MHNFQSKFSPGTCPRHAKNTQLSPLSPKKHGKRKNACKKSPLSPRKHVKKSTFAGKATPQIQTWQQAWEYQMKNRYTGRGISLIQFFCVKYSWYWTTCYPLIYKISFKVTQDITRAVTAWAVHHFDINKWLLPRKPIDQYLCCRAFSCQ